MTDTLSAAGRIDRETPFPGVRALTINRPDKKNALTDAMYRALAQELRDADAAGDVGAVVLRGAGGAFTAGNDLFDFLKRGATSISDSGAATFLFALSEVDVALIAAVRGPAIGIGATMLLHVEHAFAAPDAMFQTPFVNLGLCAEGAASLLAPERLGRAAANRLLLAGEALTAADAEGCGLIDRVAEDPDAAAFETAQHLASKPRAALRETKRLMRAARAGAVREAIDRELAAFDALLRGEEAQTLIAAFAASRSSKP